MVPFLEHVVGELHVQIRIPSVHVLRGGQLAPAPRQQPAHPRKAVLGHDHVKRLREQLHGAAVRVFVADEQQVAEICV